MSLNEYAEEVAAWATAKGFWEQWEDSEWLAELIGTRAGFAESLDPEEIARVQKICADHKTLFLCTKLMLMVSELSEALEDLRDGNMEHFKEELADAHIRLFDTEGKLGHDVSAEVDAKMDTNETRPYRHGRKL